jgi:hypothetical protein
LRNRERRCFFDAEPWKLKHLILIPFFASRARRRDDKGIRAAKTAKMAWTASSSRYCATR